MSLPLNLQAPRAIAAKPVPRREFFPGDFVINDGPFGLGRGIQCVHSTEAIAVPSPVRGVRIVSLLKNREGRVFAPCDTREAKDSEIPAGRLPDLMRQRRAAYQEFFGSLLVMTSPNLICEGDIHIPLSGKGVELDLPMRAKLANRLKAGIPPAPSPVQSEMPRALRN